MQLVHMDVSLPGTNARQVVGPLSAGLNAIAGPRGSGKSQLIAWLRQVTADTYGADYVPRAHGLQNMYGQVELRNHGVQLNIKQDATGHVTHNRLANYDFHRSANANTSNQLSQRQRQAFALLADVHDLRDNDVALDDVARRLGLENRIDDTVVVDRDRLVTRERDLVVRLDQLQRNGGSREDLVSRRRDVEHKLDGLRQAWVRQGMDPHWDRHRLLDRYAAIQADLQGAEAELQQIDSDIAKSKAELKQAEIGQHQIDIEPSYREQLQQLEDRLSRWRKTLRDLKSHRESLQHDETEAHLDEQIGTQLSGSLQADPRAGMRSLEAQLHQARKQLDEMIGQYWPGYARPTVSDAGYPQAVDPRSLSGYQVQRDAYGRTHISYDSTQPGIDSTRLPEMLRSMQRDLHDICHQLSRQEAANNAASLKHQVQQLRRSESELLQSVERLIEERGILLRKIADKYNLTSDQVSLTFGDWCQCNDHPHLYDWLLQEEAPRKSTRHIDSGLRSQLEENLLRLDAQRREAALRAEECRRQLREANRAQLTPASPIVNDNRQAEEAELLRQLDTIINQLSDLDSRDRLIAELDDVRRQLAKTPGYAATVSEYRQAVDRNIVGLSGSLYQRSPLMQREFVTSRQYDTINGVVTEQPAYRGQYEVPTAIVRTAQRLAIGQLMAARGESVPVILDQTLDSVDSRLQQAAIAHLALAAQRLQIILMTDDQQVIDLVRQHRGHVVSLHAVAATARRGEHINQQLSAFANDEEADKWYQPTFEPLPAGATRDYYLNDRSPIEQHPSIHTELANRCRALGVDRIGNLLDLDPVWLANSLRATGVDADRVSNWQATALLLCSVRNLRPFDARVLVGAGVRSAAQLSEMRPSELLDRVEQFLATEHGRRIMRSGNRFEHSRINNWISAARNRSTRYDRPLRSDRYPGRDYQRSLEYDRDGYETERNDRRYEREEDRQERHGRNGGTRRYAERNGYSGQHRETLEGRASRRERPDRTFPTLAEASRAAARETASAARSQSANRAAGTSSATTKYYLELSSPVVDAPSIGERMADRLRTTAGIHTVEQLLAANAETLANQINNRRVTAETVTAWQDQAKLVCRIPFLRGHDAQMLVAVGINSPELLLTQAADNILNKVSVFAKSTEGQRVLRGSKEPDLAEVNDWISWAGQCRSLNAA